MNTLSLKNPQGELETDISIRLHLEFDFLLPLAPGNDEGGPYIREITGEILGVGDLGDTVKLGTITLSQVLVDELLEAGEDVFYLADGISHSLSAVVTDIWQDSEFVPQLREAYGEDALTIPFQSFVLLENLQILPEFRGCGVGRKVVEAVKVIFGRTCSLIVLKPFDTTLDIVEREDENDVRKSKWKALEDGQRRLQAYYEKSGFRLLTRLHMTYCPNAEQPTRSRAKKLRGTHAKEVLTTKEEDDALMDRARQALGETALA
jgi:ribosomal protein S18 acetylase RimI-like enzyme